MAVDLFSENSNISPRISFSRDFCQSDVIPIEQRPLRSSSSKPSSLNSSVDFDFCIPGGASSGESFDLSSWSADELFCNGKILPTEIKKKPDPPNRNPNRDETAKHQTGRPELGNPQPGRTKPEINPNRKPVPTRDETTGDDDEVTIPAEEKPNTRSFWGFKRSSSLNCGSGYGRSLCPLPALLSRSNSTGSTANVAGGNKQKQSTKKQTEPTKFQLSSSNSNNTYHKPPLKKSIGGYSYGGNGSVGGGVRVNPVLNVVPSGNLFGLGSIFSGSGKDKNRKR